MKAEKKLTISRKNANKKNFAKGKKIAFVAKPAVKRGRPRGISKYLGKTVDGWTVSGFERYGTRDFRYILKKTKYGHDMAMILGGHALCRLVRSGNDMQRTLAAKERAVKHNRYLIQNIIHVL